MSVLSQTGVDIIIGLVNKANPQLLHPLTDTDVTVGPPTALSDGSGFNATVAVSAKATSPYYFGDVAIRYNRLDIAALFAVLAPNGIVEFGHDGFNTVSDLVTSLNQTYGLNLGSSDYVDAALNLPNSDVVYTFQIASTSLVYQGSVDVTFLLNKTQLSSLMSSTTLGSLDSV